MEQEVKGDMLMETAGGSGVVIVKYQYQEAEYMVASGGTITTYGNHKYIHLIHLALYSRSLGTDSTYGDEVDF